MLKKQVYILVALLSAALTVPQLKAQEVIYSSPIISSPVPAISYPALPQSFPVVQNAIIHQPLPVQNLPAQNVISVQPMQNVVSVPVYSGLQNYTTIPMTTYSSNWRGNRRFYGGANFRRPVFNNPTMGFNTSYWACVQICTAPPYNQSQGVCAVACSQNPGSYPPPGAMIRPTFRRF